MDQEEHHQEWILCLTLRFEHSAFQFFISLCNPYMPLQMIHMAFGQWCQFGTSDLLGIAHKLNLAMRTKREAISRLKHFLPWLNLQQTLSLIQECRMC